MNKRLLGFVIVMLILAVATGVAAQEQARYVGHKACADCHEEEYSNFMKYTKKAKSDKSVKVMLGDLTEEEQKECYACHATGFGKPGGFVSYSKTPELGVAGCEVCHGPGSLHVEDGDPEYIKGDLTMDDCVTCHNPDRVRAFDFKPLTFAGAH